MSQRSVFANVYRMCSNACSKWRAQIATPSASGKGKLEQGSRTCERLLRGLADCLAASGQGTFGAPGSRTPFSSPSLGVPSSSVGGRLALPVDRHDAADDGHPGMRFEEYDMAPEAPNSPTLALAERIFHNSLV